MKTMEILLCSDYLSEPELAEKDLIEIHSCIVKECNKSKNIVKLTAAVGMFSALL